MSQFPYRKMLTRKRPLIIVMAVMILMSLSAAFTPVESAVIQTEPRCGEGYAPDYGLNYALLQPHWTVGWEGYASEAAVNEVDMVLDELNADAIAQTMILIKPQDEVSIPTNCAVHFLRYMQLGLPEGERKDNGFVFLIVVGPERIDVHYAVGLGLPALTAYELTSINRAAEAAYESTQDLDAALLTIVHEFDTVARANYTPLTDSVSSPENNLPAAPIAISTICAQLCIGIFAMCFLFWLFGQMGGISGGTINPYGGSRPWSGGFRGFPSGGRQSGSGPRMRGGSGSGRSGRTN